MRLQLETQGMNDVAGFRSKAQSISKHGETVTGSRMYGERLQRQVVFYTNQQSSQAMSRQIHGLEARVSKMEGKLCALCLELKQVQQILITNTNKFSPYMPNVSHHVEVEAKEHQSLEDPLAEMVKILVPSCVTCLLTHW